MSEGHEGLRVNRWVNQLCWPEIGNFKVQISHPLIIRADKGWGVCFQTGKQCPKILSDLKQHSREHKSHVGGLQKIEAAWNILLNAK